MTEDKTTDFDDLLFAVRRSVRYHDRRVSFFEGLHRLVLFLAMIAGSASIVAFTSQFAANWAEWKKLLPPALIAILTGMDLVVGSSSKARLHDRLNHRFIDLERKIRQSEPTDEILKELVGERLMIESDEPPILRVLDKLCHNEVMRSMGYPTQDFAPVGRLQRLVSPFFDLSADVSR